jgi:hypothetical protein
MFLSGATVGPSACANNDIDPMATMIAQELASRGNVVCGLIMWVFLNCGKGI